MNEFELLINRIKEISDQQINETISKGALKMTDEQIATVSFTFWLVYMAETDLNDVLTQAWKSAGSLFSEEVNKIANQMLQDMVGGTKVSMNDLEYFSDKIRVYGAMFGNTEHTKLLWKLKDIRNDLSHNRINDLKYEGQNLSSRKAKEDILIDYFKTLLEQDLSKSTFWNSLTEEQRNEIEALSKNLK